MSLPLGSDQEYAGSGGSTGISLGRSSTDKIAFYGDTPIVQRTAAVATSAVGTASSADVTTDLKAAVLDIMNTLAALGLWEAA